MSGEKKRSDKKERFIEFLSVKAALPSDALSGDFRLEIRGRNFAIVYGCRRILKYTPTQIILSSKGFSVGIDGERLSCSSYHEGAVCIEGYIKGIAFDPDNRVEVRI